MPLGTGSASQITNNEQLVTGEMAVVDPAAEAGTDIGNVGRNVLRGPNQSNFDFSVGKRFQLNESSALEFHAEFLNISVRF